MKRYINTHIDPGNGEYTTDAYLIPSDKGKVTEEASSFFLFPEFMI